MGLRLNTSMKMKTKTKTKQNGHVTIQPRPGRIFGRIGGRIQGSGQLHFFSKFLCKSGQLFGQELAGYMAGFYCRFFPEIFSFLVRTPHSPDLSNGYNPSSYNHKGMHFSANIHNYTLANIYTWVSSTNHPKYRSKYSYLYKIQLGLRLQRNVNKSMCTIRSTLIFEIIVFPKF